MEESGRRRQETASGPEWVAMGRAPPRCHPVPHSCPASGACSASSARRYHRPARLAGRLWVEESGRRRREAAGGPEWVAVGCACRVAPGAIVLRRRAPTRASEASDGEGVVGCPAGMQVLGTLSRPGVGLPDGMHAD